jgi:hypothetical protein
MRRDGSGGKSPAGRVLELVYERFEQQDHQKMRQQIRLGRAFICPGWSLQTDQTFQSLEREFDTPSETIKRQNIGRRKGFGRE